MAEAIQAKTRTAVRWPLVLRIRFFQREKPPVLTGTVNAVQLNERSIADPSSAQKYAATDTVPKWRFPRVRPAQQQPAPATTPKAASTGRFGRFLFFVALLLTSAVAMKFGTLLTRSKAFHPNWPAKSADSRTVRLSGD